MQQPLPAIHIPSSFVSVCVWFFFLLRTALLLPGCSEFQNVQHVGFMTSLMYYIACVDSITDTFWSQSQQVPSHQGIFMNGSISQWCKLVTQLYVFVCDIMWRFNLQLGNSSDWEDVDVAMTNLWCCIDSIHGCAMRFFILMLKLLNKLSDTELETFTIVCIGCSGCFKF